MERFPEQGRAPLRINYWNSSCGLALVAEGDIVMKRKKISYPDNAWLRLDDPNNLMVITGLMTFDEPLDYERLKAIIEQSFLRFTRFRQRLVPPEPPFMRPYWEDDPNFDLDAHLERLKLPSPADQETLQNLISGLMSKGFDYTRPLWQFYLVENYGNGGALIARLHHSIGDGISLLQLLLSMTTTVPNISINDHFENTAQYANQSPTAPGKTLKSSVLNEVKWSSQSLWEEGKKIICDPSHARYRTLQVIDLAASASRLALRLPDPPTVFKGSLGIEKCVAWSEPIELADVKYIGKTFNSTVNDVLISAVSGALGHYTENRGETTKGVSIHSFIPINLRPVKLDEELGNKFGMVILSLPIGIDDPVRRLRRVKHNMDELKSSSEAIATFGIINLLGAVPPRFEEMLADFFDTKGTLIMTNVPGPQLQLYLAGAPINTLMAWVPQTGRIAFGVSIVSYNGKVWLSVASDKGLVPDPETVITYFNDEFREMKLLAQETQAERQKYLKPMLSKLDEAIQTLDELLAEENKG